MVLLPIARTPMDEKSGRAAQNHVKEVEKMLSDLVPWQTKETGRKLRRSLLRKNVQPGEVVVMLDGDELADNPLYADAKVTRE